MPDLRDEARSYFAAVGEQSEAEPGHHPSVEELISFCQPGGSPAEREKIQSHLVQCDSCVAEFKNVNAFFAPAAEGEEELSEIERQREWGLLRDRLKKGKARPSTAWISLGQFSKLALVASLLLAMNLALWIFLRSGPGVGSTPPQPEWEARLKTLEEENRRIQQQAADIKQNSEKQSGELRRLEEENRRLQEQAKAALKDREVELAELRRPQLNTLVYDVLPQEFITRSGNVQSNRIPLPSSKQTVTLILNGTGQAVFPKYSMAITDAKGRPLWRAKGVRRGPQGNFALTLDRRFLRPGEYRFKLVGQTGARTEEIAEYRITVEKGSR